MMLIITHGVKHFEQTRLLRRHQVPFLIPQVWNEVLSAAHLLHADTA